MAVFIPEEAYEAISKRQFEIDFLMLVAAVGAALFGHWAEGGLLFLFSFGHSLEHYAIGTSRAEVTLLRWELFV